MGRIYDSVSSEIFGSIKHRMKSLAKLYHEHDGKVSDKWSFYLTEYERLLAPYRDRPVRILEIGVQNGGSLEIWGKYFEQAEKIIGCDLNPDCERLQYDDARISVIIGNANADKTRRQILKRSNSFDIIIDDGSHQSKDVIQSFAGYFPSLNEDGLYVVEDLHCSYWQEFAGGLNHPASSIAFLKHLIDIINREHWGIDKARSELLRSYEHCYKVHFVEGLLREIHSLEFLNSLCVIRKFAKHKNLLGKRIVTGVTEVVVPMRTANGTIAMQLDQRGNRWADYPHPHEEELLCAVMSAQAASAERDATLNQVRDDLRSVSAELAVTKAELTERQVEAARSHSELAAALQNVQQQLALTLTEFTAVKAEFDEKERLLTEQRVALEAELREAREQITSSAAQLMTSRAELAHQKEDDARQRGELETALHEAERSLQVVVTSTAWRFTGPARTLLSRLSPDGRRFAGRIVKAAYSAVKPHRMAARIRLLRKRAARVASR